MHVSSAAILLVAIVSSAAVRPPRLDTKERERIGTIYADSKEDVSSKFTNKQLRSMSYRYDPQHPMPEAERRTISDPVNRARFGHPDEPVQVKDGRGLCRTVRWKSGDTTNAEYVSSRLKVRVDYYHKQKEKEAQSRKDELQRTGNFPIASQARRRRERFQRIKSANPKDILQLRTPRVGTWRNDEQKRTNEDYIRTLREQGRQRSRRYLERKKAAKCKSSERAAPSAYSTNMRKSPPAASLEEPFDFSEFPSIYS